MDRGKHSPVGSGWIRWAIIIALGGMAFAWTGLAVYLAFDWPFTETHVIQDLEHFSSSEVRIQGFRKMFFPHPGYTAQGLIFSRWNNGQRVEIASVRQVTCAAGWISILLFQHRVRTLDVAGAHVYIPHPMPRSMPFYPEKRDKTTVTRLTANGATLDIAPRTATGETLRFQLERLVMDEVKQQKSIPIDLKLRIPKLPGDLTVHGRFGPIEKGHIGNTQLSGRFQLDHADLNGTGVLGGSLNSTGSFRGPLTSCDVAGTVAADNFELKSVNHPVKLAAKFDTLVNGVNGNVTIRSAFIHYLRTELEASGAIESVAGQQGKVESISVRSKTARVEDLLTLFTKSNPPALAGPIQLQASIVVPPGSNNFLRKLQLNGGFRIPQAYFLHASTQRNVNKLSDRARGSNSKEEVVARQEIPSSFAADVLTHDGFAFLRNAEFHTPGAFAVGGGTYNMLTQEVALSARLKIQASLSKAAGGVKSVLLLPLDPFFKKENAGAVLPVQVTGTFSDPKFHVSLK